MRIKRPSEFIQYKDVLSKANPRWGRRVNKDAPIEIIKIRRGVDK
jgi:hypothetical protein